MTYWQDVKVLLLTNCPDDCRWIALMTMVNFRMLGTRR